MNVYLGIDLGSTTSKAVFIDEQHNIVGRGITNTRANYTVAADIARMEAEFNTRFTLLERRIAENGTNGTDWPTIFTMLQSRFQYLQFERRFESLTRTMKENIESLAISRSKNAINEHLDLIFPELKRTIRERFMKNEVSSTSEFFRDLFNAAYLDSIQKLSTELFDPMVSLFDRSITPVENESLLMDFTELVSMAMEFMPKEYQDACIPLSDHLDLVAATDLEPKDYIGTGYGRQLLPFKEEHIKSEILCHAMGAHMYFPKTRTVLDIGGQDTKAIQVDEYGLVTSFQMNDRCAAGCGRYLGYIADEMNTSVSDLGPIAMEATYEANICSTCTVFAGAELREYLNLGEKKENILAGLHKAIVQRAFALVARSGGVKNEMTFTGGVARNAAVVKYVRQLIEQNYGEITTNIHADSIFMGALGAAIFSHLR